MHWEYSSSIGTLKIRKFRDNLYVLEFDSEVWGVPDDPRRLADNVYTHTSDCDEWDECEEEGPVDLSEWALIR